MAAKAEQVGRERLEGTIERITFHNADNGFSVLQLSVDGRREHVPVVGHVPDPRVGEYVEAIGRWVVDRRHGQQFQADQLRIAHAASAEGVLRYLSSGVIRGVGPHLASLLVETFGTDLFEVLDKQPKRLLKVRGLGRKRLAMITESWQKQRAVRDIMVFLHEHGIGGERAVRIHKAYGDDAVAKIKRDPYRLATDIRGIAFTIADQLASRLGIDRQSPLRARAGVDHVLRELTNEGHCAYPQEELVFKAVELLQVDEPVARAALEHQIARGKLIREEADGQTWIYLAALHRAECGVAECLRKLQAGRHPLPSVKVEAATEWVQKRSGLELAGRQREAIREALRQKVLIITGGPGVGKTTIINCILKIATAKELECVLCAPTGRAAKRMSETTGMEAKTIHRLLEFDPKEGVFRRDEHSPLAGELFVVDEVSMMDVLLSHALLRAIPPEAAVLLVGDVDQLPAVGPGNVLADTIRSGVVPTVRLTEIFRQADESRIVRAAHAVNSGEVPDLSPPADPCDFYFVHADEPEAVLERIAYVVTERIPSRFGFDAISDIQVLTPMNRGTLGAENLNRVLQARLNPAAWAKAELQRAGHVFRVGDRVMQIENDYDKDVFNGDVGRLAEVDAEAAEATVDFDGRPVRYERSDLDQLVPAYAVTIHKSQGSEYPAVVVPVHTQHYRMLQRNLIYTAITRGQRLVVLVGTSKALAIAVSRAQAAQRYSALARRLSELSRQAPAGRVSQGRSGRREPGRGPDPARG